MIPAASAFATGQLKQAIKDEASRLGFVLAGFTSAEPPPHFSTFERWLAHDRHGSMAYMVREDARLKRGDPHRLMPECRTILVLGVPYSKPVGTVRSEGPDKQPRGRVAAYAWGEDYHRILPGRLTEIVGFIERKVGHPVRSRWYTDTGPILERDLAQRAGLGWIGKNTCLINPRKGSYFLLAEILLDLEFEPDAPFATDHCGSCTRCIEACPTECILPDRTLEAARCISYLTIESREAIPPALRPSLGEWIFGCDVCQIVCPWNRFAAEAGDDAFRPVADSAEPILTEEMRLSKDEFKNKYKNSAVMRPARGGYLRNVAVAIGNSGQAMTLPVLQRASRDADPLLRDHATWAIECISGRQGEHAKAADCHQ